VSVLAGHEKAARCVAYLPNPRWALSGGEDKAIRLWDLEAERCVWQQTTSGAVLSVSLSEDEKWAAAGTYDRRVLVWRLDWEG
jgi:WD40 repeat protein